MLVSSGDLRTGGQSPVCINSEARRWIDTVISGPAIKMGVKIGDYDLDTNNISPADVEKLRAMLPMELQQPGKLTQLEIILEAIHYIQLLQNKLTTKEP